MSEINDLENQGQEMMLENDKVSFEEVEEWGNKFPDAVARHDIPMDEIESKLRSFKEMEKQNATEQGERRMELMVTEMQLLMKKKEDKAIKSDRYVLKVKLPKLVITRFNGTQIDWFRFWNQFEIEINRSELPAISKFPYLKELISPMVRVVIDGLPFTNEGYTEAKNILISMVNPVMLLMPTFRTKCHSPISIA